MKLAFVLPALAASACGRLDFANVPDAPDAGVDAPCRTVWTPVGPIAELNSPQTDWSPAWGQDRLQIVFESNRDGDYELYLASRSDPSEPFSAPRRLTEINTPDDDRSPSLSRDGLQLFWTHLGGVERATRLSPTAPFTGPGVPVNTGVAPDLGRQDLDLIYGLPGVTEVRLAIRSRPTAADLDFGPVRVLDEPKLPSGGYPTLSADGLELFLELGENVPLGWSTRPDVTSPFSTPTPILELGAAEDPDISPDGQWLLYVTYDTNEISLAKRSCAP
ncbi:MAG: hypothetical protein R3B48_29185 [Kofleriaceae bacterium]